MPIEEPTVMKFHGFTEQTLTHDIRTYHETEMTPNTFKHDNQHTGQQYYPPAENSMRLSIPATPFQPQTTSLNEVSEMPVQSE